MTCLYSFVMMGTIQPSITSQYMLVDTLLMQVALMMSMLLKHSCLLSGMCTVYKQFVISCILPAVSLGVTTLYMYQPDNACVHIHSHAARIWSHDLASVT